MNAELIQIDPGKFLLEKKELYTHVAPGSEKMDSHSADLIQSLGKQCLEITRPLAAVVYCPVDEAPAKGQVAAKGHIFETGGTIAKMLRGSQHYAFFIATAGPETENLSRSLLEAGEFLEGYIVDVIASSLAEQVAEQVHQHVRGQAEKSGWGISNRYSPGYCGWPVHEQQLLFSLFPEGSCGITLSTSSLMHPIKSVSGLIGMGKEVIYRDYTCELCSMTDCIYRKTGKAPQEVNSPHS